jgi:hypothetical protein
MTDIEPSEKGRDAHFLHPTCQENRMSTNPLAPNPVTDLDGPEVFPPIDSDDRETLEDDYGEPPLEPGDEVPEEDPDDEPLAEPA